MTAASHYRGRFAPSPTGPLHFGSLVAAVGSYLDAKYHHGTWLVRMEDLDSPRCILGAAEDILRTLAAFGLQSDEPVLYQSQRTATYEEALRQLQTSGVVYPCCCTRKEIADSALHGIEGLVYPGTCRDGVPEGREGKSWRVRTNNHYRHSRAGGNPAIQNAFYLNPPDSHLRGITSDLPARGLSQMASSSTNDETQSITGEIKFDDVLQGHVTQNIEKEIGDFVVKRVNGLFSYQLAVVVDDAFQGITHVVRGADLLASTARQIHLQHMLGLPTPVYMHLPVAVNESGEKLSKQTLAAPVNISRAAATLISVINFLQLQPPAELAECDVRTVLDWAIRNWDASKLLGVKTNPLPSPDELTSHSTKAGKSASQVAGYPP
jgi:glutamyl-Q tRNA(Asp) synthetase